MNPFTDQIAQAIGDPGSITERIPDEPVSRWCARAVGELLDTAIGIDIDGHYSGTPASRALTEQAVLRGRLREAESILADYADDEPCDLDHEGYCQSHGLSDTTVKLCRNVRAQRLLVAALPGGVPVERDELVAEMAQTQTALAKAEGAAQRYREAFGNGVTDRRRLIGELRRLDAVNVKQREARADADQLRAELAEHAELLRLCRTYLIRIADGKPLPLTADEIAMRLTDALNVTPTAVPQPDEPEPPCHCPDAFLENGVSVPYCLRHGAPPVAPSSTPSPDSAEPTTADGEPSGDEQFTLTGHQRQCDVMLSGGEWCRLVLHHRAPCTQKALPKPIEECYQCWAAPRYPFDPKVQQHAAVHQQHVTAAPDPAGGTHEPFPTTIDPRSSL